MLKLRYLIENFDLARLALTHWSHDESALERTLHRFRISDNAVYPYLQDGRLCFLRLAPVEEKRPGAAAAELALIQALRSQGYPAMEPLPARDGQLLLTLSTPWGQWYAQAFAGVPGTPIEALPPEAPMLLCYGEALGRLHTLHVAPTPCPWSCDDALCWMEQTLHHCAAPQDILAALHRLRTELDALPRLPGQFGIVHYDFEPDNVFWDERTQSCAVIDFADCMLHWYALDIQQALAELPGDDARALFLQGYQQARPLPDQLNDMLPLMQRFMDLYGYTRVLRCLTDPPHHQPDWMPGLIEHLKQGMEERAWRITAP